MHRRQFIQSGVAVLVTTLFFPPRNATGEHNTAPGVVYYNVTVCTADMRHTDATAVAVQNGTFIAVGTEASMQSYLDQGWRKTDLRGQRLIIGISDDRTQK